MADSVIQSDVRGRPEQYSGRTERGQLVRPDAIFSDSGEEYNALDPCPTCDSRPHDAPEGVKISGDPHWTYDYCWKCGYRPGVNVAVSQARMRQQFQQFQDYMRENTAQDNAHPSLQPPSSNEIENLKAQMAEVQLRMAERNSPQEGIGTNEAFSDVSDEKPQGGNS